VVYSPAPLVHHDNWLDRAQFARMMKVAVRVDAAIFSSYALRFDRTAFVHVLRTGWRLAQDRLAIGSTFIGLTYFVMGLALAPKYSLLKPPRLEAA
jgi:hypothetical protein